MSVVGILTGELLGRFVVEGNGVNVSNYVTVQRVQQVFDICVVAETVRQRLAVRVSVEVIIAVMKSVSEPQISRYFCHK